MYLVQAGIAEGFAPLGFLREIYDAYSGTVFSLIRRCIHSDLSCGSAMSATGRPPKVRGDYMDDAQGLLHLSRAVKADSHRPVHWRNEVIDGLNALVEKLIKAPAIDTQLDILDKETSKS